ncbi:esterase E4-like [Euwallacea fornicatus]|uniref:esterase E4-like n=1 Tax=Euwallacea fornicatus TaxID=995702 RepID=UPI00338E5432
MHYCIILLAFFSLFSVALGEALVILPDGKIQGKTEYTRIGQSYNSFYGVRYGKNPTNELRLQEPQPVDPWEDVFDATVEKGICYQTSSDNDMETENCLLLNVFTPVTDLKENAAVGLPVMFYIHGGGFIDGTGISEWGVGPHYFMEYGVILVAINYRLGPFGYLSTGDDVIPGNFGMKDQILALKWVQKNIEYFGGDPKKVTIFGQSAGAASVSYLLLSPLAEGLFRAAILESGSALDPWAYQRDQVEITYKIAALLNSDFETNRNSTELLKFLQSVSGKALDEASNELSQQLNTPDNFQLSKGFYYAPVIEQEGKGAFLTLLQYGGFETGQFIKVPVMIGLTAEESLFMIDSVIPDLANVYDKNPSLMVPLDIHVKDKEVIQEIGQKIKHFYSANENLTDNFLAVTQYHSNQDFDKGVLKQAELQSNYVPVYFYEFTYSGKMGNDMYKLNGSGAVVHGEEQNYIFNRWYSTEIPDNTDFRKFPEADVLVHYRFMSLFTNFAKELNPTPRNEDILQNVTWPMVEPGKFQYLEIGKDLIEHETVPKAEMYKFWNELYDTYAKKPYDTF